MPTRTSHHSSGVSRSSRRQQQQRRHAGDDAVPSPTAKGAKALIPSPDKTEASTPPSSPEAASLDEGRIIQKDNDNQDNNNGKKEHADWGVAPGNKETNDEEVSNILPKEQQQQKQQKQGLHEKFLSVDKILCRAPSHDSNISDLSASLSPNPTGGNRWGEMLRRGKSIESESGGESKDNNNAMGRSDNIVLKVLHECGVLDNVNDLLRLHNSNNIHNNYDGHNFDNDDMEIPPPPPPSSSPPPPPPPTDAGANQKDNKKRGGGGFCYEIPAVWGVAPGDDLDDDDDENIVDVTGKSKSREVDATEVEEEYDIVELVLDEAHLTGTSQALSSSFRKGGFTTTDAATASSAAAADAPSPTKAGVHSGGGKNSVVLKGILKNKLSSMKLSSNKSPTPTSNDASPLRPVVAMSGSIGGMAVVDPSRNKSGTSQGVTSSSPVPQPGSLVQLNDSAELDKSQQQQQQQHSRLILTSSQQKKLASVIKRSNSGSVGGDPPGIVAENDLFGQQPSRASSKPSTTTALAALDKVDRALTTALSTSDSNVRSTNSYHGDIEIHDALLVKEEDDEDADVDETKKKGKKSKKSALGGFSFKSKPSPTKKDPPTSTEDDKPFNADASTTTASDTRRSKSLPFRRPKKGIEVAADIIPSYASVSINDNVPSTSKNNKDDKNWKAVFDTASKKYYYYHKVTREVRWEKPLGYDEAKNASRDSDNTTDRNELTVVATTSDTGGEKSGNNKGSRKSIGFLGRSAKESKQASTSSANKDDVKDYVKNENKKGSVSLSDEAKYWRVTIDGTTNKPYYYNKKTKEVTWKKPACLYVGKEKDGAVTKFSRNVAETTTMASVAEKRKKTWFKRGGGSDNNDDASDRGTELSVDDGTKTAEKARKNNSLSENVDGIIDDSSKYWRAALDASSGKTYYFNKKTQLVSWIKPEGFVEEDSTNKTRKEKATGSEERETVVASIDNEWQPEETVATDDDLNQAADTDESSVPVMDDFSEIEGFTDAEAIDHHVEQTNGPAKEDTPFDEPFDCVPSSPKRAHFEHKTQPRTSVALSVPQQQANEDEDDEEQREQDDIFIVSEIVASDNHLNRRVKSLKSTFSIDRQRTFASQTTETTRKVANTNTHQSSAGINRGSGKNDGATLFEESLNNSSIASEIFDDDEEPGEILKKSNPRPSLDKTEVYPVKHSTAPLSSRIAKSIRNMSHHHEGNNRRYPGKRAENLGDSSIDSIEEEQEEDRYLNVDDDVSALSGIGNEPIDGKVNRRGLGEVSKLVCNVVFSKIDSNVMFTFPT